LSSISSSRFSVALGSAPDFEYSTTSFSRTDQFCQFIFSLLLPAHLPITPDNPSSLNSSTHCSRQFIFLLLQSTHLPITPDNSSSLYSFQLNCSRQLIFLLLQSIHPPITPDNSSSLYSFQLNCSRQLIFLLLLSTRLTTTPDNLSPPFSRDPNNYCILNSFMKFVTLGRFTNRVSIPTPHFPHL